MVVAGVVGFARDFGERDELEMVGGVELGLESLVRVGSCFEVAFVLRVSSSVASR